MTNLKIKTLIRAMTALLILTPVIAAGLIFFQLYGLNRRGRRALRSQARRA